MGTVESMIDTMLKCYRRVTEENRRLNERFQNCAKLIRVNSEAIITLENEIKKFKDENPMHKSNVFNIDGTFADESDVQQQLVGTDEANKRSGKKNEHLTPLTKYIFWTIFTTHTIISLIKKFVILK